MKKLLIFCMAAIFVCAFAGFAMAGKRTARWEVPGDFSTIQEAIDSPAVSDRDTIFVEAGNHSGAYITKSVEIKGRAGAVIDTGPAHGSGLIMGFRLLEGSDGATISHLVFDVDLAIMNGDAVNDVTVDHCAFMNAIQAVSNWGGCGWQISHNVITDLRTRSGGGIGILIADRSGGIVTDNVVSHNEINGTLSVDPDDCGGYSGTGIVVYADFRWGMAGAETLAYNRVVKNTVSLVSDTPDVVDAVAFELTDTRDDDSLACGVIHHNAIGFNDFRGTETQIALTPETLDECNDISRNFGKNRGHGGKHPSIFGPQGHGAHHD